MNYQLQNIVPVDVLERITAALKEKVGPDHCIAGTIHHHDDGDYSVEAHDVQDLDGEEYEDKIEDATIVFSEDFFDELIEAHEALEMEEGFISEVEFVHQI